MADEEKQTLEDLKTLVDPEAHAAVEPEVVEPMK